MLQPRVTAACVVVVRDGAILAVSRKDRPGAYGLPGGKVELGESPERAAARELQEETGLHVGANTLTPFLTAAELTTGECVTTFAAKDPGGEPFTRPGEGVVCWVGWPALLQGPFGHYNAMVRKALIDVCPEHWIATYGSGSLRYAVQEAMRWREMYLEERVALEYGYGFEAIHASRCLIGDALAASNDPGTTETCWWARALRYRAQRDSRADKVQVVHARVTDGDGATTEGIALYLQPDPWPAWLPKDRKLIAFTTDAQGRGVNPC